MAIVWKLESRDHFDFLYTTSRILGQFRTHSRHSVNAKRHLLNGQLLAYITQ